MDTVDKPEVLFDRELEWTDLASFAANPAPGATLAIMYGRRRQGKTLMLELLAEAREGFLFTGLEQSSAQNLAAMSEAYRVFTGAMAPVAFAGWDQVLNALLALGERERPLPVIIDELPYLLRTAPEIPSIIQRALSPRGRARQRSRARLVLCGSALSVMSRLLGGTAALRGRASREMMV
ncbi:MAG TPA: ATP-binding protein, partial [Candidatus Eisenbacteria bacterium]|nr:ATP-binding protein [Candidatus Eisenbacteria bacterium]